MLKRLGVVIPSTILTLLMAVGFSTPAFAYVDTTEVAEEPVQVVEETEPTEEERIPFTIAGNGEVEDNIVDDPSKEFFTVKTKGGNTFFLVIDRARNNENVYMLSMIDEYDLQEFLDDEERNGKQEEETPAVVLPETKPEPTPDVEIEEPKEESRGGMNKIQSLQKYSSKIRDNPSSKPVHQSTNKIIIHLITPTLRSASGQGERPRRQPRVPDAPKIKHDKMKQFYMVDIERKMW